MSQYRQINNRTAEMKTAIYLLFLAIVVTVSDADCPENWVEYEDACFLFSTYSTTEFDAENRCKAMGPGPTYLASVDSAEKMKFITDILIPLGHLGHRSHWIGGRDYVIEGTWRWIKTGLGIKYFAWGPGEPDGSPDTEKDCIAILNYNGTYLWSDEDCESRHQPRHYFICEQPHTAPSAAPAIG